MSSPARSSSASKAIVFFDGACNLCNHSVQILFRIDRKAIFQVASLQGQTASRELASEDRKGMQSILVKEGSRLRRKSDAVLYILESLGGFWRLVKILRIIPGFIRDWIYDLIAKNRYSLFGKRAECMLPTPEQRSRFLD